MTRHLSCDESLCLELRALDRRILLIIVERAIELLSAAQLDAVLGDSLQLERISTDATTLGRSLLDEAR
ncbi:hypothetical protein [Glaciimonas soli]|uniref:Uncharacterized protein n=1 Tax=Glaciimonas soli TaxID=2590999 RepID=A0A843YZ46_9BURK|nr:hypothetical protein [Glaciimonas soli]MQR02561.1 hypothetical protein [Glaciimonas soli]